MFSSGISLRLALLAVPGLVSVALWLWVAQWRILADHAAAFLVIFLAQLALYAFAALVVRCGRVSGRGALVVIFAIALMMRLVLLRQPPTASDDIYRYVWDGRVQAVGINPYAYPPDARALMPMRDAIIYPGINRKSVRTIYPPVAEAVFRLVYLLYPNSVTWTKLALALVDLGIAAYLARILARHGFNPCLVALYAWQPLLVLEVAHSGHIDIVAVLFLLFALQARRDGRMTAAGIWLACGVLVKFYLLAALPALLSSALRRRVWRLPLAFGATALLAYLPFLSVGPHVFGFLGGYAQEEGFFSGERYFFLQQAIRLFSGWSAGPSALSARATSVYTALVLGILGVVAVRSAVTRLAGPDSAVRRAALLLLLLFCLTTTSQPWYVLVLLVCVPLLDPPLAVACSVVAATASFTYLHWWLPDRPEWPFWVAYGGRAVALGIVGVNALFRVWPRRLAHVARLRLAAHSRSASDSICSNRV